LIHQLATRAKAVQELALVYHDAVYEFNGILEHFSQHVDQCLQHLGSEGFESRFKDPNPDSPVAEFINELITQYNHRAAGRSVGEDGQLGGEDIVDLRSEPRIKSLLEIDAESFKSSVASSSGEKDKETGEGEASLKAKAPES